MVKYCTKMEMIIKLNFTMIDLIFNVVVNVSRKWKEKIGLHLILLSFFQFIWVLGKLLLFLQNKFAIFLHSLLLAMHL